MSATQEYYTATLCQKDCEQYEKKDETLRTGPIHTSTSFITREQLKSRKAPEGHNFVTSGSVREPWVKKVADYTVMVVTQVNHSQSVNKPPVDVCTANALGPTHAQPVKVVKHGIFCLK
ncbi:hypothetical protein HPB50_008313 [Hyalomma asiaticum]|uniref:Uncharacterized protein n=1 Tax=Hyalomma asiaticum TaxID=266040 RepID=A0ACB7STH7_HYAAI|nr:hypothetical protein HPB50_008313 [Hyalomma asiaticum]